MKTKLKYLGIGLFIAGLLFSVAERFPIPYIESSLDETAAQQIKQLEKEKNAEIKSLKAEIKKYENVSPSSEVENDSTIVSEENIDENKKNEDIVYGTIYVYEDVSLYDIGKQAEDLNLVKNGRELELFLSKREYARSIQKGQFDLDSSMTIEEMAEILTGKATKKDDE